jgi:hypothetical protein
MAHESDKDFNLGLSFFFRAVMFFLKTVEIIWFRTVALFLFDKWDI